MVRVIVVIVSVGLVACAGEPRPPADRPAHPVLDRLEAPVTNAPLRVTPTAVRPLEGQQSPAGQASVLLVTRDGQPFAGNLDSAGEYTIQGDRIRFTPVQGSVLDVRLRLPAGLTLARQATFSGRLTIAEASSPAAADRTLVLRDDGGLLLAEIWRQTAEPVSFDLGDGLRIVQQGTRGVAGQYTPAGVSVMQNGETLDALTVGERARVSARAGTYDVIVETSSLYTPAPADADQYPGGYILRVWVTAVR